MEITPVCADTMFMLVDDCKKLNSQQAAV